MPVTQRKDAHGVVTIERRLRPVKRALGGMVFGVLAGLIGHPLVTTLLWYRQHATREEFLDSALGFAVMFLGFLLFAVPAWMFVFWRAGIVVSRGAGTVRRYSDYLIYRRERSHRIEDVAYVRVSRLVASSQNNRTITYPVVLVMKDEKVVTVADEAEEGPSRRLAQQLATRLRVRCRNLVLHD